MSGSISNMNEKEAEALRNLKTRVQDVLLSTHDNHYLSQFLKARRYDVRKAEKMYREHLVWRKKNGVDTILEDYVIPEVCLKYWPGGSIGLDKEGHIVRIIPMGNIDPKGLLRSAKASDLIKTNICIIEKTYQEQMAISRKLGRQIDGATVIFDLEHLNVDHLWKPGVTVMVELFRIVEEYYPGLIHSMFVVRSTKLIPIIYVLFKPVLSNNTRSRIRVLGSNWQQVLVKYIDAEILPVHWGGTMTDSDGNPNMCPSKINLGGKVPAFYYKTNCDLAHPDMTSIEISGKKSTEIKYKVSVPGSILRYEFKTESHDIAFGISRVLQSGKKAAILDEKRYSSHIVPEDGEILLEEPGLYVVRFDNRGSAFQKTRKLSYWMELTEPYMDDDDNRSVGAASQQSSYSNTVLNRSLSGS